MKHIDSSSSYLYIKLVCLNDSQTHNKNSELYLKSCLSSYTLQKIDCTFSGAGAATEVNPYACGLAMWLLSCECKQINAYFT